MEYLDKFYLIIRILTICYVLFRLWVFTIKEECDNIWTDLFYIKEGSENVQEKKQQNEITTSVVGSTKQVLLQKTLAL